MLTNYWKVNELLHTFGNGFTQTSTKVTDMAGNSEYGISLNKVIEVVDALAK